MLGDIAGHPDHFDSTDADERYREALVLSEGLSLRPLVANCHLSLGTLYRRAGECDQARDQLIAAATMYRDMNMLFWLEQAEAKIRPLE